jgi:hypothetical protein
LLKDYDHITKVQDGRISIVFTDQQKSRAKPSSTDSAGNPAASATSEAAAPEASGVDASPKNEVAADSKLEKAVPPNGPLPPRSPDVSLRSPRICQRTSCVCQRSHL